MGAPSRYELVLEWAMSESVSLRCPACRREHLYAAPVYPCACGTPVAPTLDPRGVATTVVHRSWDDEWVPVHCTACGRENEWPSPELGCPCGVLLRVGVAETGRSGGGDGGTGGDGDGEASAEVDAQAGAETANVSGAPVTGPEADRGRDVNASSEPNVDTPPEPTPGPSAVTNAAEPTPPPTPRRPFQPITIRTARDAVTAAAVYLRWLGYRDIRRADQRPPTGIGIAAHGLLAQVDPTVAPASLRDVECLWLTAMTESVDCVYFSLAGYAPDARARADSLGVPLFVLDLTGTPQPVNSLADDLDAEGAR